MSPAGPSTLTKSDARLQRLANHSFLENPQNVDLLIRWNGLDAARRKMVIEMSKDDFAALMLTWRRPKFRYNDQNLEDPSVLACHYSPHSGSYDAS